MQDVDSFVLVIVLGLLSITSRSTSTITMGEHCSWRLTEQASPVM